VVSPTVSTIAGAKVHKESLIALTPAQIRSSAIKNSYALPDDSFWDRLAVCETNSNWQDGGQWAGGLGIYTKSKFPKSDMGTWERFGGEEFAPSPGKATREEQIIVANRIAVIGWKATVVRDADWAKRKGVPQVWEFVRPAVGLNGWGCYKSKSTGKYRMEKPRAFYYENPSIVPLFNFSMNEESHAVHDLQVFLGNLKVDGQYGPKTRAAHVDYLKKKKITRSGVPALIVNKTKAVEKKETSGRVSAKSVSSEQKRCPKYESALKKHGLPVARFSSIMWRESRCEPKAIGWNYRSGTSHKNCKLSSMETYRKCPAVRSYDLGLLQVNSSWVTVTEQVCKSKRFNMKVLLHPECNLKVAKHLYENGGLVHWKATSGRS